MQLDLNLITFCFRLWWVKQGAIGNVKMTNLIDLKKHKLDQTLPTSDILKWKLLNLTKRDFLNLSAQDAIVV